MLSGIVNFYFLAFTFIIGFLIGKLLFKSEMEDLRQNMADLYLENQALTLKIQKLEAESKRKSIGVI
jgi:regulator of replication initiation timing